MTNILGIKYGGHDTAAALVIDGELIAACAQERYTLDKHSRRFPLEAAMDCLRMGNIAMDDVHEIAYVNDLNDKIREVYLRPALESNERLAVMFNDLEKIVQNYKTPEIVRKALNYHGPINYYRHHLCHVASAYFVSGFDQALCVSNDGIGEYETSLIASGVHGEIKTLRNDNIYPHSLGLMYSGITDYLGWTHHCDEGIVMGLAAFGDPHSKTPGSNRTFYEIFKETLVETGDYAYEINRKWLDYYTVRNKWVTDLFIDICGPRRVFGAPVDQRHMDIAAGLQTRLEEVVLAQLARARDEYSFSKLCLAGGVSLNCSLNGKIESTGIFDEIFVQPASGDDGCAIGACLLAHSKQVGPLPIKKVHDFYKGSRFTENEIVAEIIKSDIDFHQPDDLYEYTAQFLAKGKIVAWYQGSSEFGPRALGNRSILCRPYPAEMKDILNARVKFREPFRPFAPAVMREYQENYFTIGQDSPHMLIACKVRAEKKNDIPAVVHIDDSCRIQTVTPELNERFYRLLDAFYELSGIPILLNTSFNVKGQPIVNTPNQAIETFQSTNIDVLVLGNHVAKKP